MLSILADAIPKLIPINKSYAKQDTFNAEYCNRYLYSETEWDFVDNFNLHINALSEFSLRIQSFFHYLKNPSSEDEYYEDLLYDKNDQLITFAVLRNIAKKIFPEKINEVKDAFKKWCDSFDQSEEHSRFLNGNNALSYWITLRNSQTYQELATLALYLVGAPPTEAEVERIFSIRRMIVTKNTTRISEESVRARTYFKSLKQIPK